MRLLFQIPPWFYNDFRKLCNSQLTESFGTRGASTDCRRPKNKDAAGMCHPGCGTWWCSVRPSCDGFKRPPFLDRRKYFVKVCTRCYKAKSLRVFVNLGFLLIISDKVIHIEKVIYNLLNVLCWFLEQSNQIHSCILDILYCIIVIVHIDLLFCSVKQ